MHSSALQNVNCVLLAEVAKYALDLECNSQNSNIKSAKFLSWTLSKLSRKFSHILFSIPLNIFNVEAGGWRDHVLSPTIGCVSSPSFSNESGLPRLTINNIDSVSTGINHSLLYIIRSC